MSKSFSAKVLLLLLVIVLGGAVVFFQNGEQKKSLTSDILAPVVTPAACYFQSDLDKKIAEKKTLEDVQQKSVQEIQTALLAVDATILSEEQLVTQKKELDVLGEKKMTPENPSKIAYMQAEKKMNSTVKPVVPVEPTLIAAPVVPVKPTLAPVPVVPRKPVEPRAPTVPAVPRTGTTAYQMYIRVTKPRYDAAKKVYDEQTKPAYDKAKKIYDDAVAAKKVYDTITKPAYTKAMREYNLAVAAKRRYDLITKPAYDRAKRIYDTAVAAKKVYNDAVLEYNNLFEQYNNQLAEYTAYVAFKSALDTYASAVIAALEKNIDSMKQDICPATESLCANKIDDDRDNIQDCDDSDCSEDAACKKDVVTCTEDDGFFRFEHSNGSTDFTGKIFSMGGPDPYSMSYEIEYSAQNIIFKANTYIDGEKIDCPAIITESENSENEEPETCDEILTNLLAEGHEDANHMKCTGTYSFSMTYDFEKPEEKIGLLSNFLKSDFFNSEENSGDTTDTCDTANCYECGSNQTRDDFGNCIDVGCPSGQEEVNGQCVDTCTAPQVRNDSGTCEDQGCPQGQEEWNGACMPVCEANQVRNTTSGACEDQGCPEGQEKVNDSCVDVCIPPQTRQNDGTCSSGGYCGNGTIEPGEECDGGSQCDSSCKTTTPYCGDGTVDAGEECDDSNKTSDDGCSASCTNESGYCGDGTVDSDEECDGGSDCDSDCKKECSGSGNSGLGSNFFGLNLRWLQSNAAGGKKCPIKGCTIKAAENYEGDPPDYEENNTCTCKNNLDPYQYDTCRCQPTHPWCYHPKGGECVKAKFFRKAIVSLIRGAPKTCAACMTSGAASFAPIPSIPLAADFKLYKPTMTLNPKKYMQNAIATAQECQ